MPQFFKDNPFLTNHNRDQLDSGRFTAQNISGGALSIGLHNIRESRTGKIMTQETIKKLRSTGYYNRLFGGRIQQIILAWFSNCILSRTVTSVGLSPISSATVARYRSSLCSFFFIFVLLSTSGVVVPVLTIDASYICNKIPGLVPRQRIICRSHPDAMAVIGEGGTLALDECRHQFRSSRWNCYGPDGSSEEQSSQPLLNVAPFGSRESAFAYAIRSAGITHAITTACSRGSMQSCGCDRDKLHAAAAGNTVISSDYRRDRRDGGNFPQNWSTSTKQGTEEDENEDWKWGGCSANVNYGLRLSRSFVDARESINEDSQSLVNLHNNRVGRKGAESFCGGDVTAANPYAIQYHMAIYGSESKRRHG